jgi:2,5-diketo-D-gluconate reductase B
MKLPLIGLGTWDLRGAECTKTVQQALDLGYRHIDTAHGYENHTAIQNGIKGFDRKKLFITSKIALEQVDPNNIAPSVEKACNLALKELATDYLDLYLIHWPDHKLPMTEIFKALEHLKTQKKILQAGVSNFTTHHLKDLLNDGLKPSANQVEFHPYLNQKDLLDYCRLQKIELIAYRPLGKGALLSNPLFKKLALQHKKTPTQIILRWFIEQNIPVIPKASSKKHLQENLDIFDFSLTSSEMEQINKLNKNKRFCGEDNPELNY